MERKKILSIISLVIFLMAAPGILPAQTFEEYKKQQEAAFKRFSEENTRAYEEFVRKEEEGLEKLRREIEQYWGEGNFRFSTQKEWVDYSQDKQSRSDVDFEAGLATVEVLLTPDEAGSNTSTQARVKAAVGNLVFNTCSSYKLAEDEKTEDGVLEEPVLAGQLTTLSGQPVSVNNADVFINEVSNTDQISYEEVDGADGSKRIKATVTIRLIPDHVLVRAKKFMDPVDQQAARFDLPKELIFAVIETESSFNPMARSHIPAYGLMQIVPRFAGREAYYYIHKKDSIPSPEHLYQPHSNIELGTAYFKRLTNHYFKGVKNSKCRVLCAVAAYNTGARNFYKAFPEQKTKKDIIDKINTMAYKDLLAYLEENLPHEETRKYVAKVDEKMKQYSQWQEIKE